ncbi:MAG: phosphate signaling complex protein PhoU [Myxococcota bacterium]
MLGSRHLDSKYDTELKELGVHMQRMAVRAESMVRDAIRALLDRDAELARAVIRTDRELDKLELEADEMSLRMLARRSPFGEDLRFVTVNLKIVTDLERMGDLAVNIAERSLELMQGSGLLPGREVQDLADAALTEVSEALRAYQTRDSAMARAVLGNDRNVDALNRAAFELLIRIAHERPDEFDRALALTSVCRYLERVADHATNVAEMVVFLVEAEDVRHQGHGARPK